MKNMKSCHDFSPVYFQRDVLQIQDIHYSCTSSFSYMCGFDIFVKYIWEHFPVYLIQNQYSILQYSNIATQYLTFFFFYWGRMSFILIFNDLRWPVSIVFCSFPDDFHLIEFSRLWALENTACHAARRKCLFCSNVRLNIFLYVFLDLTLCAANREDTLKSVMFFCLKA